MIQFRYMNDARRWCAANAAGKCTVIIHGDPYEYKHHSLFGGMILERQYTWAFQSAQPVHA